jgi:hypothetical protein
MDMILAIIISDIMYAFIGFLFAVLAVSRKWKWIIKLLRYLKKE